MAKSSVSGPRAAPPRTIASTPSAFSALVTIDGEARVVEMDAQAEAMFGRRRSDALGRPIAELVSPNRARPARWSPLGRALEAGPAAMVGRSVEVSAADADGRRFPVELAVWEADTTPERFALWIRDLSDERALANEVERGRALLASIEELAQLGSWEWDLDTGEVRWSENVFRLLGMKPPGVDPTLNLLAGRVHPEDRDRVERKIELARVTGIVAPFEYRIVRDDRSVRRIRAAGATADGRSGSRRLTGSVQDVTEFRQAEREAMARLAVSDALLRWVSFEHSAPRLLRRLATALDCELGLFWGRTEDALLPRAVWHTPAVEEATVEMLSRPLPMDGGADLPGRALRSGAPTTLPSSLADNRAGRREAALASGLRSAVAVPVFTSHEVLAVVELYSHDPSEPTDRLTRSLTCVGHELGQFLASRRSEFSPRQLTPREIEVLQLAAAGCSGPRIAEALFVSPATVKTHFENIFSKWRVSDRTSAVAKALRQGWIE